MNDSMPFRDSAPGRTEPRSSDDPGLLLTIRALQPQFSRILHLGPISDALVEQLRPLSEELHLAASAEEPIPGRFELLLSREAFSGHKAEILKRYSQLLDRGGYALFYENLPALLELRRLVSQCGFKIVRMVPLSDLDPGLGASLLRRLRPLMTPAVARALRTAAGWFGWAPDPVLIVAQKGWGYAHD